jgi:FKBP-type peptidyl-prolyl cis-trans isomerase FkpA
MFRFIIAALICLLASQAFAGDAPKTDEKKQTSAATDASQGSFAKQLKPSLTNKEFYDKAAAEKGMIKTGSGLLYKSLKEGSGASPSIMSTVKVSYRGTLKNGKEFNSSARHGGSESHRMNRVFRCWQEGLQKMKVGGKAKLVCPPELAFADRGVPYIVPKNAIVIYEIELLGVK